MSPHLLLDFLSLVRALFYPVLYPFPQFELSSSGARVTTVGPGNTVPTFTSPVTQALARTGASVNLLEHTATSAIVLQVSKI